jgi:hypothetical protein
MLLEIIQQLELVAIFALSLLVLLLLHLLLTKLAVVIRKFCRYF